MNQDSLQDIPKKPVQQVSGIQHPAINSQIVIKNDKGMIEKVVNISSSEKGDYLNIEYGETDEPFSGFQH
jgi:hypothetical protein